MSRFDSYFLMKSEDVIDFVKEKSDFFDKEANLSVKEIGDGNLNYVFRVVEESSGKSVIVKHAGQSLRIDSSMTASTDRNRIESEILLIQHKQAPGKVPEVYYYDTVMCACIMEDLTGYKMMRTAMIDNECFPLFADHVTDFIVKTQLSTTDIVMNHSEKKELVKSFINPDLCEITEDLVLTEPYNDLNQRNSFDEENREFVEKELYQDSKLSLEVAKLKFNFMNNPQALIHGDLHTGSIFIKEDDTRIFDPEFAFFGPIGYDLGNVIANLEFAWCNGYAKNNQEFCEWVEDSIVKTIDLFIEKSKKYILENATDFMAKTKGFEDWYVGELLKDTAGYTGTELHRRTIGMAKVKDVTILEKEDRVVAQRICLLAGKDYILNRESIKTGSQFLEVWKKAVKSI